MRLKGISGYSSHSRQNRRACDRSIKSPPFPRWDRAARQHPSDASRITGAHPKRYLRPWTFSHVFTKLPWQLGGMLLSAYFTVASPTTLWHMLQIWTIRPRVTFFIGNLARVKREWGYMNHALSSVVLELFICAFSTYFVGSLLSHTSKHNGHDKTQWYTVMLAASVVMMVSTAMESLWAVWMVLRFCLTGGRGDWLIWAAYLYSSPEAYCPMYPDFIHVVWILVPVLTTATQAVSGSL
ncbi:hypothetical protein QBC34DRAFT_385912 [Podospora aff. communis PSN243]|uniref:Uncharacterized protein n=1 Tax=Podospora aff. communis PSN243 TaxID=3040156 RepID=A0AAV9G8I1_9PEZI|nr:hypothetical protein QBC34DRAFT_385912 [Podospora aff. communis PSN243]